MRTFRYLKLAGIATLLLILVGAVVAGVGIVGDDSTGADVTIEGVPAEELSADGFIIQPAPLDASPRVSGDEIVANMSAVDRELRTLDVVLVTFQAVEGEFKEQRLAWAISLDPATIEPDPIFGGRLLDFEALEKSRVVKYAVEFYDANTGEFLIGTSVSGVAE